MEFSVNGFNIAYEVESPAFWGANHVLFEEDNNQINQLKWKQKGYTIEPFLSDENMTQLLDGIKSEFKRIFTSIDISVPNDFDLANYHQYAHTDSLHNKFLEQLKVLIPVSRLAIDVLTIRQRIAKALNWDVSEVDDKAVFGIRVLRPGKKDYNPLHKDVWLDHLREAVNLYVPLAGSNENSSLILIEGSHLWRESSIKRTGEDSIINGKKYSVPAAAEIDVPFEAVRPNPDYNNMLLFTPYMLHGAAANFNANETRLSLEMRFWRNKE